MKTYKTLKELQEKYKGSFENATVNLVFHIRFGHYDKNNKIDKTAAEAGRFLAKCRTSELGGWKYTCECGKEVIMYKGCHNKSCDVCSRHENIEWLEFHRERLPDTKYLHSVFVLPEALNDIFLRNKVKMTDLHFKVVKKILKKRYKKLTGGTIIIEHTAGSTQTLHPHLHCLVMLVGYDEKKNKFVEIKSSEFKDEDMKAEYEKEYRKEFKKIENKLNQKEKTDIDNVTGFSVWREEKYSNSTDAALKYFSNSVRGGPISNDQILKVTESTVIFAYKNEQTKQEWSEMKLPIDEFIKRFLLHIPAKRQKQVRKTGVFASCKKEVLEKLIELIEGKKVKLETKKEKKKAKREIGEKIVLFCPNCGAKLKKSVEIAPIRKGKKIKEPA